MTKRRCSSEEKSVAFYENIKNRMLLFLPKLLVIIGQIIKKTNAEKMVNRVQFTDNEGKKYEIIATFIMKEIP